MIGDYLEKYSFQTILEEALSQVPADLDKRQGSIIYDALAPTCYRIAELYMNLHAVYKNTFASTATEEYLDERVGERGITRRPATYAEKIIRCQNESGNAVVVPIGARFSATVGNLLLTYVVYSAHILEDLAQPGEYVIRAEVAGEDSNMATGVLSPITRVQDLATATIIDTVIMAQEQETDEELRTRYYAYVREVPFAGNVAHYEQSLVDMDTVGAVQVYPVWNGGGTVAISVVGVDHLPLSSHRLVELKNIIDPSNGDGLGLAPIGHDVTIMTPEVIVVNVSATCHVSQGINITYVRSEASKLIQEYVLSLRKEWGVRDASRNYSSSILISRIISQLLSITGVYNVSDVTINNLDEDLFLQQTAELQTIPVVGGVLINEN